MKPTEQARREPFTAMVAMLEQSNAHSRKLAAEHEAAKAAWRSQVNHRRKETRK